MRTGKNEAEYLTHISMQDIPVLYELTASRKKLLVVDRQLAGVFLLEKPQNQNFQQIMVGMGIGIALLAAAGVGVGGALLGGFLGTGICANIGTCVGTILGAIIGGLLGFAGSLAILSAGNKLLRTLRRWIGKEKIAHPALH